eukprot:g69528.t1
MKAVFSLAVLGFASSLSGKEAKSIEGVKVKLPTLKQPAAIKEREYPSTTMQATEQVKSNIYKSKAPSPQGDGAMRKSKQIKLLSKQTKSKTKFTGKDSSKQAKSKTKSQPSKAMGKEKETKEKETDKAGKEAKDTSSQGKESKEEKDTSKQGKAGSKETKRAFKEGKESKEEKDTSKQGLHVRGPGAGQGAEGAVGRPGRAGVLPEQKPGIESKEEKETSKQGKAGSKETKRTFKAGASHENKKKDDDDDDDDDDHDGVSKDKCKEKLLRCEDEDAGNITDAASLGVSAVISSVVRWVTQQTGLEATVVRSKTTSKIGVGKRLDEWCSNPQNVRKNCAVCRFMTEQGNTPAGSLNLLEKMWSWGSHTVNGQHYCRANFKGEARKRCEAYFFFSYKEPKLSTEDERECEEAYERWVSALDKYEPSPSRMCLGPAVAFEDILKQV